jgi:hypothetical protein
MAMDKKTIDQLAEHLENCQLHAKDTLKITDDHPDMDWKDAYDIQDEVLARKLRRGARVVGFKAGLTSHAKMKQMNVDSPVFGFLVDEFSVPEGGEVKISELIHPKVEAEICFITKHDIADFSKIDWANSHLNSFANIIEHDGSFPDDNDKDDDPLRLAHLVEKSSFDLQAIAAADLISKGFSVSLDATSVPIMKSNGLSSPDFSSKKSS